MNWEIVGSIADILGALAVVITLLYLARQTRVSATAVRAATRSASAIAISEIDRDIARDPELARLVHKSFNATRDAFDEVEWFRFTTFARSLVGLFEDQYMQAKENATDPETASIHLASVIGMLDFPAWATFWEIETRGTTWRADFIAAVDARETPAKISGAVIAGRG
jgi:hypothetical protein